VKQLDQAPDHQLSGSDPIFYHGKCFVDGPVGDPMFGIQTRCHPVLYRDVEVFCWVETSQNTEKRLGDQVKRSKVYTYTAKWVSDYVDSRSFRD